MEPIGLYLHIPFCDGKCNYCNFFSKCANSEQLSLYTEHLISTIRDWGKQIVREVDTVYFGGGTPSLLGHNRLIRILNSVFYSFQVLDNAEITVEVNPTSSDDLDFSLMKKAGFNRLSIGMQSANDNELKILGRRHTAMDARRTVERAQQAGFDNISLDVMLAIPEQTMDSLEHTLRFCAECQVQHISAYILAPLATACSYSSRIIMPAPSPITNPERSLSQGIDALFGSSESVSALQLVKPFTASGVIVASAPPAMIASASPYFIA